MSFLFNGFVFSFSWKQVELSCVIFVWAVPTPPRPPVDSTQEDEGKKKRLEVNGFHCPHHQPKTHRGPIQVMVNYDCLVVCKYPANVGIVVFKEADGTKLGFLVGDNTSTSTFV